MLLHNEKKLLWSLIFNFSINFASMFVILIFYFIASFLLIIEIYAYKGYIFNNL